MSQTPTLGSCFGVGVGPGDPELITVKALNAVQSAPVVAFFAAANAVGNARQVVNGYLVPHQTELRLQCA